MLLKREGGAGHGLDSGHASTTLPAPSYVPSDTIFPPLKIVPAWRSTMQMLQCPNCGKPTGFKRALGFGTLFMVVLTCGLWLLPNPLLPGTMHQLWSHSAVRA